MFYPHADERYFPKIVDSGGFMPNGQCICDVDHYVLAAGAEHCRGNHAGKKTPRHQPGYSGVSSVLFAVVALIREGAD